MPGSSKGLKVWILGLGFGVAASAAQALPIGFGVNQGGMDYDEIKDANFIVYLDHRVQSEGKLTLNALEAARPHLEAWFNQHRQTPLPVIMSAVTENASFANFITDAIELQTMGQGTKDLAWHEYTHSTMYRAFDSWLGPSYALMNLPWMPAWFLEGLAEAMSVSAGSDVTAGIERYQALSGDWPSYDRLHSLYSKANFFERGYATSGALVSWLLRHGGPDKLPALLDEFYRYTMPWWWPWGAVPFNGFMPMDQALRDFHGLNEAQTYEQYKKEATAFWTSWSDAPFLAGEHVKNRQTFTSLLGVQSDGKRLTQVMRIDGDPWEVRLKIDPKTGWVTNWTKLRELPSDYGSYAGFTTAEWQARVKYDNDFEDDSSTIAFLPVGKATGRGERRLRRPGAVYGLWETDARFVWVEQHHAQTRVCSTLKTGGRITCDWSDTVPKKLRVLGQRPRQPGDRVASEIWFSESEEKLTGTQYSVVVYDGKTNARTRTVLTTQAQPLAVAFAGADTWLLLAERNQRTVRRIGPSGECLGMLSLKDHILDVQGFADGGLALGIYAGDNNYVKKLAGAQLAQVTCTPADQHTSPIEWALVKGGSPDLQTAMDGASLWQKQPVPATPEEAKAFAARPPADEDTVPAAKDAEVGPATWHGRPLFIFPWIGADDALGMQLGVVSIPLMDNEQNETVQAMFLYGVYSHFPDSELSLVSTRFRPTLSLTLFREQSWEGDILLRSTDQVISAFQDEKGARFQSSLPFKALGGLATFGLGVKYSYLHPFIGPSSIPHGWLLEPASSLGIVHTRGRFTFSNSVSGRVAPGHWAGHINESFNYNQVGASTQTSVTLPLASKATLGVDGSRTRGPERRVLQEFYTPLKTFIPGSGGGYNQNSFPLTNATTSGLFSPQFGDSQARAQANWTAPLVADVDKWFWLVYAERLDFTAFFNYGGAWDGDRPPQGWDHLTRAHGYDVDLQLENKGVRFNLGLGVGQVIGQPFELYLTTGFDALF